MANELRIDYTAAMTMTARIRNVAGQAWHVASAVFETYGANGAPLAGIAGRLGEPWEIV